MRILAWAARSCPVTYGVQVLQRLEWTDSRLNSGVPLDERQKLRFVVQMSPHRWLVLTMGDAMPILLTGCCLGPKDLQWSAAHLPG